MTEDRRPGARLLAALRRPHPLTDHRPDILTRMAAAEVAGLDVDADPTFTAAVQHLDWCPECAEYYAQLCRDLRAAALVQVRVLSGFGRQISGKLQSFRDFPQRCLLQLTLPPAQQPVTLAAEGELLQLTLDNLPGAPIVSVILDTPRLSVVLVSDPPQEYQVTLHHGPSVTTVATRDGIAAFNDPRGPAETTPEIELQIEPAAGR